MDAMALAEGAVTTKALKIFLILYQLYWEGNGHYKKKALMPSNAKTWATSAQVVAQLDVKQRNIAQQCATSAPINIHIDGVFHLSRK